MLNMFDHLQISDRRERFLVGTADLVLEAVSPMITRHSRRSSAGADRILVLRLERVGDFLMALPGIRAVRRLAPHARIDLVVGSWSAALAGAIADVDQVEILDVRGWLESGGAPDGRRCSTEPGSGDSVNTMSASTWRATFGAISCLACRERFDVRASPCGVAVRSSPIQSSLLKQLTPRPTSVVWLGTPSMLTSLASMIMTRGKT